MEWWVIALIALGVLLLVGIIVVGGRRAQERRVEGKRTEATELREEAASRAQRADERERVAEEEAERARRERELADDRVHRADEVDPDARD